MTAAPQTPLSLLDRFWSKVNSRHPTMCWLWQGARSRGGRREVYYGNLRHGRPSRKNWRVHRLALLLKTAPVDCPRDDDESTEDWLIRARRWYSHLEASHVCDVSLCCNPAHLEWSSHQENVHGQTRRRRAAVGAQRVGDESSGRPPVADAVA